MTVRSCASPQPNLDSSETIDIIPYINPSLKAPPANVISLTPNTSNKAIKIDKPDAKTVNRSGSKPSRDRLSIEPHAMDCSLRVLSFSRVILSEVPCASIISCSACTVPEAPTQELQPTQRYS